MSRLNSLTGRINRISKNPHFRHSARKHKRMYRLQIALDLVNGVCRGPLVKKDAEWREIRARYVALRAHGLIK